MTKACFVSEAHISKPLCKIETLSCVFANLHSADESMHQPNIYLLLMRYGQCRLAHTAYTTIEFALKEADIVDRGIPKSRPGCAVAWVSDRRLH